MATSIRANRAVTAGISGGVGIVLPLAAVAVTIPFGEASQAAHVALPFAVGALAGVGLFALTDRLSERAAERRAAEEAEAAAFTSIFNGTEAVEPRTAQVASAPAAAGKRFVHRTAPKGVPVISRAVDALDEADAWAEIDAMLNEDSPISCDPARSKDMYEIALDELRRVERARTEQSAPVAEAAPAPAAAVQPDVDEADEASARAAAMASLYGAAADAQAAQPVAPAASAARAASAPAPETVAVADYTGHESTWAAALAILEDDAPVTVSPSETAYVAPDRMAAIAEGGSATRDHAHVNALIKEEFDRMSSPSVRHTSREYLRVIQGGTASMPRLQAQAQA